MAKHGTVVLVGRDRGKLDEVQKTIEQKGQHAVSVVCDLSDPASVRSAAAEIVALLTPINPATTEMGMQNVVEVIFDGVADHPLKDRNPDYLLKLAIKLSRDMGLP